MHVEVESDSASLCMDVVKPLSLFFSLLSRGADPSRPFQK